MIEYQHIEKPRMAGQPPIKGRMNKTAEYELTIVVPVYNEEDNIYALEQRLSEFISQQGLSTCVLFVNDGSVDHSKERIMEVCARQKHFYHLSLLSNSGLSAALKAGIDTAFSTYVGYMDADLQTTPEDFNLLLPFREDFEMVLGIRTTRQDSSIKRLSSKIANGFRRLITKDGITDTGCPLKIMKTSSAKQIPFFNGMHRFLPALVQLQNGRVKEVPVRHFPRMAGHSKYTMGNRVFVALIDCFAFRWMKSRYLNFRITETNTEQ